MNSDETRKVALITGSSSGIGYVISTNQVITYFVKSSYE